MAVLVISYNRADQPQVRAVVTLLRTALRDIEKAVFWDGDLEPGDPWFEQLKGHIETAPQLFVFWCAHSAQSPQVRRELTYALDRSKRVVPLLLDNTPLPAELAAIHGIDLRLAIVHDRIDLDDVINSELAPPFSERELRVMMEEKLRIEEQFGSGLIRRDAEPYIIHAFAHYLNSR